MSNKLSEEAFNQLLLQISGKQFLNSINMMGAYSKSRIEKCIAVTKEEYDYTLSLKAECLPDSNRMIMQVKKD